MKLPHSVYSALGDVSVVVTEGLVENSEALGMWDVRRRKILIEPDQHDDIKLHALMHECTHVALTDSGVYHLLAPEMHELIADAVGAWIAGAIRTGHLKFGNVRR